MQAKDQEFALEAGMLRAPGKAAAPETLCAYAGNTDQKNKEFPVLQKKTVSNL